MDGRSISPDDDVTPRAWAGLAVVAAAAFVATLDAMVLYVAFGQLVNQTNMLQRRLWVVILVVAAVNALLAPLFVRLMRWAFDLSSRDLRPLLR